MQTGWRIGVDLGGTKTEAVVVRFGPDGPEVRERRRVPTPRRAGGDAESACQAIVQSTAQLVHDVAGAAALARLPPVGVAMPGGVTRAGLVKNSNTTELNGRPFRQQLAALLTGAGVPEVAFDNDANCFALAEAAHGAAAPALAALGEGTAALVFGVIIGTGTGGGVVLRPAGGRPAVWPGLQGIAGEWGHQSLFPGAADRGCYCGAQGCVETFLAGPSVEADYARRAGTRRGLPDIVAARATDVHAQAALATLIEAFGRALANLIDLLDPTVVVLGGGVSNLDLLYDEGVARVRACVFSDELLTPVVRHALGDSAGVLGAALLVGEG